MPVRTVVQDGPKGKKVVAFALDWPGSSRGAKAPDATVDTFEAYRERYRTVARHAGLESVFAAAGDLDIVEDHIGAGTELGDFAKRIGVLTPPDAMLTPHGLRAHREQYLAAFRDHNAQGKMAGRSWTIPFLIRHTAFHVLDHAWEMEDKDLS